MKLTDTQLAILSASSRRDDRTVVLPENLKGGAARKVIGKLLEEGLLEEIRARGSMPVWRRSDDGAMTLRITKQGLKAIQVDDAAAMNGDADADPGDNLVSGPTTLPSRRGKRIRGAALRGICVGGQLTATKIVATIP